MFQKISAWLNRHRIKDSEAVTTESVRNLFRKKYPKLITKESYKKPQYRPTRWAVLHGPCYGEKKFKGTLLIDLSQMLDWSIHHAKHTWTNQTLEQEAKEYFPEWLKRIDFENDAVTILDKGQYGFLKDYYSDFVSKDWHQIYCPECKTTYKQLDRQTLNKEKNGSELSWTIQWRCVLGHNLYRHNNSMRLF
ncbi:hypothetical protein G6701_00060 [Polynucleobacter paneuropaeus]|nr:hypothetical protein [Polynucleobacter paneuropaeus]MBT8573885.1 hypothetical protein [Polynucleobacter paneuropaeus]